MWPRASLNWYCASAQFFACAANHRLVQCHCTSIMMCELEGTSAFRRSTSAASDAFLGGDGWRPLRDHDPHEHTTGDQQHGPDERLHRHSVSLCASTSGTSVREGCGRA